MSFWRSRFSVRSERLGLAGMTSHPDRGQITEPGLRGGTFFAGGSGGAAFFGGGAALAGAADLVAFAGAVFFGGGAFFFAGAALAGFAAFPVLPLAAALAVALPAGRFAGAAFFGAGALLFLAVGRFAGGFLAVFVPFFATFFGTCLAGCLAADFFTTPFFVALRAGAAFFGAAVFWGGAIGNSHVGDGRRSLPPACRGAQDSRSKHRSLTTEFRPAARRGPRERQTGRCRGSPTRESASASAWRRRASTSSTSIPATRKRLRRDRPPETSSTSRSFTPSASAMSAAAAALALPSTGGAATLSFSESPCRPTTALRPAPGWTCTRSTTASRSTS